MSEATGRFRRSDRLRRSDEFRRVSQGGRRRASANFVFIVAEGARKNSDTVARTRLGVTVSRRVGNAVIRNRVKRAIREWFRQVGNGLESRTAGDLVVIARPGASRLDAIAVRDELISLAGRKRD